MAYDFDDDNSWLDAVVQESPAAKITKSANLDLKDRKWTMCAEVGQKISAAKKGHTTSAETRAKISQSNKGKTLTAEQRAKLSLSQKGKTLTAETRAKISAARKGQKHTPETRARLRIVNAGRTLAPDHAAKLRASRCQPIVLPSGQFDSITLAADWLNNQGVQNAHKKIAKWLKTHPDQVYYLPKDTK